MINLEGNIKDVLTKKLEDGTVEKLVEQALEIAIKKATYTWLYTLLIIWTFVIRVVPILLTFLRYFIITQAANL